MCTYKKWIHNKYDGRNYLVNCGKCDACQMEKAQKRTTRLINESPDDVADDRDRIFLTLTYDNKFIPYINPTELRNFCSNPYGESSRLNLYRDYSNRSIRVKCSDGKIRYIRQKKRLTSPVVRFCADDFCVDSKPYFDFSACLNVHYKGLQSYSRKHGWHEIKNKIGVVYTPDIQNFFKNLRVTLERKYNYNGKFTYFWVSEYGPTYERPHFHVLFFCEKGMFSIFRNAISEAWSFSSKDTTWKNCERAYKPSSYVSSYVNCSSSLPHLFKNCRLFKIAHHGSLHYGFGNEDFLLSSLLEKIKQRNIRYSKDIYVNKIPTRVNVALPTYVIARWFPKYKGFSKLSSSEIYDAICSFGRSLKVSEDLTFEDKNKIHVSIVNHFKSFIHDYDKLYIHDCFSDDPNDCAKVNIYDYARFYVEIWNIRKSNVYEDFLKSQLNSRSVLESYDNTKAVEFQHTKNEYIENILEECVDYERDPNKTHDNLIYTDLLRFRYALASKSRRLRSHHQHI